MSQPNIQNLEYSDLEEYLFQAVQDHLYSDLSGEGVVLNIRNGKYYGLNGVGVTIWNTIQVAASLQEIKSEVIREYDVSDETCQQELVTFIKDMIREELVEVLDETDR